MTPPKRCSSCGLLKVAEQFWRLHSRCKSCHRTYAREWYRAHADQLRAGDAERKRRRYAIDPAFREHRRQMSRTYYRRALEEQSARKRAYYWAHREREKARMRARRARLREAA